MATHPSDFGVSPHNPIRVGGGGLFGPFNERQYLARLRGRNGRPPQYQRVGSFIPEGAINPLDIYAVSGAGLSEPIRLLFDIYTVPSSFEVPSGFTLDRPDQPLNLPRSMVLGSSFSRKGDGPFQQHPPRRWRILDANGSPLGLVSWDGLSTFELDLPERIGALIRQRIDIFLERTPPEQVPAVLEDIIERFLALESQGVVRGIPDTQPVGPSRQTSPPPPPPKKKKFWPW